MQPLLLALGAGALIALLRTPIIDLALHIVGGSEAVLDRCGAFLNPLVKRSGVAGESGITRLVTGVQYARAPVILLVVGISSTLCWMSGW